ncbi:hypothetical protein DNTS_013906 [Danionella cerebrum]|uniref:Uncharacterized protein n=1 Tax=Danionella cerebrum TaxID=2873325 RepID=A0A553R768_9TELE|nr:hypothetical protein DNTS_013906 [Danionella translucida]
MELLVSRAQPCLDCDDRRLYERYPLPNTSSVTASYTFPLLAVGVELDFKLQEDRLQPLLKRLCPAEGSLYPSLAFPHEIIGSTPKRKAKAEAKKHARWKLWFL